VGAAQPDLVGRGQAQHAGHTTAQQHRRTPAWRLAIAAGDAARGTAAVGGAQRFLQFGQGRIHWQRVDPSTVLLAAVMPVTVIEFWRRHALSVLFRRRSSRRRPLKLSI